ncbi:MAG: aspartate 4-decarboxylase [Clostridiaceae bacterium]
MDKINIQREEIQKIYGKVSPFEFKDKLIELATGSRKITRTLLDAGRGNPNWISSTPREAFFTFGTFAVEEAKRTWQENDLAGMPQKNGIGRRFRTFVNKNGNLPGIKLIEEIIDYGIRENNFSEDEWVYELADAIIGDNYPVPGRILKHIEKIVHAFLVQEMCYNKPPAGRFNIFAVEGATAAMCYIFDSLIANELLSRGDRIALMVPIFTPYLEIPLLPRYNFQVVYIHASETTSDGTHTWQYPESELNKLSDKSIKALFVVNPSNPPSVAINPSSVKYLKEIVQRDNPNLMVISDDVYGTFTDNFRSLMADLPYNTIGVYSFSKYFGVTGWRLGTIALHENNVYDFLIKNLPVYFKQEVNQRYSALSTNPEEIPFIDRIVADSRQVALEHTSGLSTPQQVQMAFFCAFALIDDKNNYKNLTKDICRRRQKLLFEGLGLKLRMDPYDAAYYTEFDLLEWASEYYGSDFSEYMQKNHKPVDVLFRLAEESSIVLLSGSGFQGPEWSIRISLANLSDESYSLIGQILHRILEEYVEKWNSSKSLVTT